MKQILDYILIVAAVLSAIYLTVDHGETTEEGTLLIEDESYKYKVYLKVVRYAKQETQTDTIHHPGSIEKNWDGWQKSRKSYFWHWLDRKQL